MAFFTRTRWRAVAFTSFVALVWLNQSLGGADWEAFRDRTLAAPSAHVASAIRYPFMFLYRRAPDEALYYATASATLGKPYDVDVTKTRGDSPLPPLGHPDDGRFHMPYAEAPLEYPPPNLPFVIAPRLVTSSFATYAYAFGALMGALLIAAGLMAARIGAGASSTSRSTSQKEDEAQRIFALGLLLLAHGAIAIQRLDAIVALLLVLMVRSAIRREDAALGFWGGLLGATKFVPILVLPVLVIASGVRGGKRLAAIALGAGAGLALGLGPMIVMGRESLPAVLAYHAARGLHVESTLGVLYGTAKAVIGRPEASLLDYGSFNFHGPVADLLAKAAMPLTLVLVGFVAWASRLGDGTDDSEDESRTEHIVLAALAATTALWLGGKVFSPQYLTWALPLVLALPNRSWIRISFALGLIVLVSQIYLRGYYDHVYNQWPLGVITMLLRLALLGVLSRMLLVRLRRSW